MGEPTVCESLPGSGATTSGCGPRPSESSTTDRAAPSRAPPPTFLPRSTCSPRPLPRSSRGNCHDTESSGELGPDREGPRGNGRGTNDLRDHEGSGVTTADLLLLRSRSTGPSG